MLCLWCVCVRCVRVYEYEEHCHTYLMHHNTNFYFNYAYFNSPIVWLFVKVGVDVLI